MRRRLHYRPRWELLEDRTVPAILIDTLSVPGDLIITSIPGPQTDTLLIVQTFAGDFDITENGGVPIPVGGIFGNITINLTTFPGSINPAGILLEFDAGAFDVTGDLTITLPNATAGQLVRVGSTGGGTLVGDLVNPGNVLVTTGTGPDSVFIGSGPGGAFAPVDINGAVVVNTGAGNDIVDIRGGTVANNVTIINANDSIIGLTLGTTIEGDLTWNNSLDTTNVAGAFNLNDESVVMGHLSLTMNRRDDTVNFDNLSEVHGNATLNLGHGVNTFAMNGTAQIRGNLSYTGGNQRDFVTLGADTLVLGDVAIDLRSSGRTTVTSYNELVLNGTIMGDDVLLKGGNGVDIVTYNANGIGAELVVVLGSAADTFTLGADAVFATADIDGGFGADIFVNLLGPIGNPFALRKFP